MFVKVYQTRDRGIRLPRPKQAIDGYLIVEPWQRTTEKPTARARLLAQPESDLMMVPELLFAQVRRITARGIHITGIEFIPRRNGAKSNVDRYPQTWWCLVHTTSEWDAN